MEQQITPAEHAEQVVRDAEAAKVKKALDATYTGGEILGEQANAATTSSTGPREVSKPDTKIVPIELRGINLSIDLRVPCGAADRLQETQDLIARLKAKFGEDSLIEELSQIICGTIEKVTISRPVELATKPVPQSNQPVAVTIPNTQPPLGDYCIQSTQCPWTGNALKNLEPSSIYKVLYESQQHRALMTNQDITMMEAYYAEWYEREKQRIAEGKFVQKAVNEEIPF